jgi:hypothetical protein
VLALGGGGHRPDLRRDRDGLAQPGLFVEKRSDEPKARENPRLAARRGRRVAGAVRDVHVQMRCPRVATVAEFAQGLAASIALPAFGTMGAFSARAAADGAPCATRRLASRVDELTPLPVWSSVKQGYGAALDDEPAPDEGAIETR